MYDVIIVGGGFAGVTAAREAALQGYSVLLVEARDRLGGRTWTTDWNGEEIEYGGQWVHWHQPHTWSEMTRAGLALKDDNKPALASWYDGDIRHCGSFEERNVIADRGWRRFVDGVEDALPMPHNPRYKLDELRRFDNLSVAERLSELDLTSEEHDVLYAELESLTHAPLADAGAVAVLRWHALSGYSLDLTQRVGNRGVLADGTKALITAIAAKVDFEQRLGTAVAAITQHADRVTVETRDGELIEGRCAIIAVPLNVLGDIAFTPALSEGKQEAIAAGQASRGIKIFIRAKGPDPEHWEAAIRPRHPFGYLETETVHDDGTQTLIGFGTDHSVCDPADFSSVQRQLDEIVPGYEVVDVTAHDWLSDEFSRGTWAIHRPGWYTKHHEEMRRPEGRVLLAGSDLANGWAGFIDGAIESGLQAGARLPRLMA